MAYDKAHFAKLCVDAVLRLKGSTTLDHIHIIKKKGGTLQDSYLVFIFFFIFSFISFFFFLHFSLKDEGFILEKKFGVGGLKRLENPKILIANTAMDHDKIKIFAAKVKTDDLNTVAAIEKVSFLSLLSLLPFSSSLSFPLFSFSPPPLSLGRKR